MTYSTEQETFWQGNFGDDYTERNEGSQWVANNTALFGKVLGRIHTLNSILELGSNRGLNLLALRQLLPKVELSAVEINENAAAELKSNMHEVDLHVTSILEFKPTQTWDLVFTKGVLIHIDPTKLPTIYQCMYHCSSRYILISEYYNPSPVEINYRGHSGKLFKRDFAGEMLDRYPDLALIDYGFVYHRDPFFPQDDMNWFLLQKKY